MIKTSLALFCLFVAQLTFAIPHKIKMDPEAFPPRKVIVAVIDTGADIQHPALKNSLWTNANHLHGWNFIENNSDIQDQHGHGTHIAGLIAQNKNVQLMILKALDVQQSGEAAIDATVKAIHFAIAQNVDIINYSGGGTASHPRERAALLLAQKKGILVVAAAGNLHSNMDQFGFYPANYHLENIISVAAVDETDQLIKSSNFGPKSVLVAAAGKDLLSTLPNGGYGKMTGTSQATAVVTRVLASLILQTANPVQKLIQKGRKSLQLQGKIRNAVIIEDSK